jgi:hypothetical protein
VTDDERRKVAGQAEDRRAAELLGGLLGKTDTATVVLSGRCGACGYMLPDSPGHVNTCGPTP